MVAFVAATMLTSCSSQGPTGPAGPTGSDGLNGATGPTGNANVQVTPFSVTNWTTNANYPWEIDAVFNSTGINFSGAILCYYSSDQQNWTLLPWTSLGNAPFFEQIFDYNSSTGVFNVSWSNITPGSTSAPAPPSTSYFQIVAVPPAVMKQHPGINLKDYHAIKALVAEQNASK